jgi:hypothetical protein
MKRASAANAQAALARISKNKTIFFGFMEDYLQN